MLRFFLFFSFHFLSNKNLTVSIPEVGEGLRWRKALFVSPLFVAPVVWHSKPFQPLYCCIQFLDVYSVHHGSTAAPLTSTNGCSHQIPVKYSVSGCEWKAFLHNHILGFPFGRSRRRSSSSPVATTSLLGSISPCVHDRSKHTCTEGAVGSRLMHARDPGPYSLE